MRTLYVAMCNGEPAYVADNDEEVISYCANHMQGEIEDAAREVGRDLDEMDENEVAEMAFMAGHSGDYMYPAKVNVQDNVEDDDIVTVVSLDKTTEEEVEFGAIRALL